ncbi:DUF4166 domain-containing protein [Pseudoduganella violaceinigra]|uniref:DUF4166 domain-containing protein n=1 Tax=Pseudoduganella violaceinigra TaxID=246602 RepID=UPI00041610E8|nr:DUF4166 domain-containing protein [Pseudoduganella violaceinigra]
MERKWLVRWLYASAAAHLLVGLLLPWAADARALDWYHAWLGGPLARPRDAWWMALFGATLQCVGLWMLALVWFGDQRRERAAWLWIAAGLLLWGPQDILVSLRGSVWPNVWVDCATLALLLPALWRLYRIDAVHAARAAAPVVGEGELFRKILGAEWGKLHPDIQQRFAKNPAPGKPLLYYGRLAELSSSRLGKFVGFVSRPFIQGALIPYDDGDFPVDIQVYGKEGSPHIYKQRLYRLNGRQAVRFTSYMAESEQGEVLEYVGLGLGMKLKLHVADGNLHFTSDGYFWDLLGWRIPLPDVLTPGKTFLRHCNEAPNRFNIRIEIRHVWFGTTFVQAGVFQERRAAGKETA